MNALGTYGWLVLTLGVAFPSASGQTPARDNSPVVRRVYVPADRVTELGDRYSELQSLPRDEFEDLVRRAERYAGPDSIGFETSELQATLQGDRLLGTARFRATQPQARRLLLRWPVSNWSILSARWESEDAALGFAGRGQLGLIVPPGDGQTLVLDWSAPGRVTEAGQRFDFQIPPCVRAELALELPPGLAPLAPGGTVTAPDAARGGRTRWLIQWSPGGHVALFITNAAGADPFPSLVTYERELEADVFADATELTARFRVTVFHQPVRVLEFFVSPGVEVTGWTGVKVKGSQVRGGRVQLLLDEPVLGTEQITLNAVAAGPNHDRWELPKIELQNAVWIEGRVRVRAGAGLSLMEFECDGAIECNPGAADGTEWIVPHAGPSSRLQARAISPANLLVARVRTNVELGPRLQAESTVAWESLAGETQAVQLRVPTGWSVRSVDGVPAATVARWSVAPEPDGASLVTLQLLRPAYGDSPVAARVRLNGPSLDAPSKATQVVIPRVRPIDAEASDESVTIESSSTFSAEVIDSKQVTVRTRTSALTSASGGPALQLRMDGPEATGLLSISRKAPECNVGLATQIELNATDLRVVYQLDIEWPGVQADTLDVHWSSATNGNLHWELPAGVRVVRLESPDSPAAGPETWQLRWGRKVGRHARVKARWQTTTAGAGDIPLPVLPEASRVSGNVTLRAAPQLDVQTVASGLQSGFGGAPGLRASAQTGERAEFWQYSQLDTPRLALRVSASSRQKEQDTWIAHARLRSTFDRNGVSLHRIGFEVRNGAGRQFDVQLPPGSTMRKLESDGAAVVETPAHDLRVSVPVAADVWEFVIDYASPTNVLNRYGRLDVPLPRLPFPISHFTWELELPSGYAPLRWPAELSGVPPQLPDTWEERVFGVLLRTDALGRSIWEVGTWHNWWLGRSGRGDGFEDRLRQSLAEFTAAVRPRDRTWGRLCDQLDQFTGGSLVIDTVAMERAAIAFSEPVGSGSATAQDLFGLATNGELSLLRTARGLLLTTNDEARSLAASEGKGLRSVRGDAGLTLALTDAVLRGTDASGRFVRFDPHSDGSDAGATRLHHGPAMSATSAGTIRFECVGEPVTLYLSVVQHRLVRVIGVLVAGATVALIATRRQRPRRLSFVALGLIAAASFMGAASVPASLAPPCAVAGWGALIVAAVWSALPSAPNRTTLEAGSWSAWLLRARGVGTVLFLLMSAPHIARGESQERPESPAQEPLVVFIPFDASHPESRDRSPRVLLPRPTLQRLRELAESRSGFGDLALLRSTSISGRIMADRFEVGMDMELDKLEDERPARLFLPLHGVVIRAAQIDDVACPVEPAPGGLVVQCPGAGRKRLHLDGVVALDGADSSGSVDLSIPPAARCSMELLVPPDFSLEVDSALTSQRKQEDGGQRLRFEIASAGRLALRWNRGAAHTPKLRIESASLFTWIGSSAALEVRANVGVEGGPIRKLIFEPDPRLMLLRIRAPGLSEYWLMPGPGSPRWLVEFERPIDRNVPITLECLVRGATEGQIVVPELRCVGAQSGPELLALRGDGTARLRLVDPADAAAVGSDDFEPLWREASPRNVDAIVRSGAESTRFLVAKAPPQSTAQLRIQSDLRATRGRTELSVRVEGDASARDRWHGLTLPRGFIATRVRVSPGTHWQLVRHDSGLSSGTVASSEASGDKRSAAATEDIIYWDGIPKSEAAPFAELGGWIPNSEEPESVPVVRPIGNCSVTGTVTIWRSRDAGIAVDPIRGMKAVPLRSDAKPPSADWIADSSFEIADADFGGTWKIEPRARQVSTTVATRVLVDEGGAEWISVVDCQVSDGALETLELSVPPALMSQVQISGEGILRRDVVERDGVPAWRVQLEEPRWYSYRLMLRAHLSSGPGGRLALPMAVPHDSVEVRQFLLVLTATDRAFQIEGAEQQVPVSVETFGKWFSEPITRTVAGSFELRGSADAIAVVPDASQPEFTNQVVGFERHRAWLNPSDATWVESTLLVRSRTSGDLVLQLPADAMAHEVRVNGRVVSATREAGGRLSIYLSENDRPYEVVVLWRWMGTEQWIGNAQARLQLPRLTQSDGVAVWTVSLPPGSRLVSSTSLETCSSAAEVAEVGAVADQLVYLFELPRTSDDAERATILGELQNSFMAGAAHARHTLAAESEFGLGNRALQQSHQEAADQLDGHSARNRQLLQRLGASGIRLRTESPPKRAARRLVSFDSPGDDSPSSALAWGSACSPPLGTPHTFVTSDSDLSIVVQMPTADRRQEEMLPSIFLGLAALVSTGLLWLAGSRPSRWCVVLILAGSFWCWKLRPDSIGLVLLGLGVVLGLSALLQRRRSRRLRPAIR
jgi:hypothetical protein